MSVSRGVGRVLASVLGIAIVVIAVVIIANILGGTAPVKPLIYKSIELRSAKSPVEKADLITTLNDLVSSSKSDDVRKQWDRVVDCLASGCPDDAFLDIVLVTVAAFESDIPEGAVLINIIATSKYWNDSEHLLEFSKALSMTDEQIQKLGNRKAVKLWEQIVECNGNCSEKNDFYFELIKTVVE